MKKIFYCAFILAFTGIMFGAERPLKAPSAAQESSPFDKLPIELKTIFLKFLVEADELKDKTKFQKLQFAANNIRHYMMVNRRMSAYLDDVAINGDLLQELAKRYANGYLSEAMVALHTTGARKWFSQWVIENNIKRQGPYMTGRTTKAVQDYVNLAYILLRLIDNNTVDGINFILTYFPEVIDIGVTRTSSQRSRERESTTILIEAVKHGNLAIVDRILQMPTLSTKILNEQYDGHDDIHGTALIYAVQRGDLAMVNRLLQMPGIDVNKQHSSGYLRYAYDNKPALKIAKSLPDSNPNKKAIINALLAKGATE